MQLAASTIAGGAIGWLSVRKFGLELGPVEAILIVLGGVAWIVPDYRQFRQREPGHSSDQPATADWSP